MEGIRGTNPDNVGGNSCPLPGGTAPGDGPGGPAEGSRYGELAGYGWYITTQLILLNHELIKPYFLSTFLLVYHTSFLLSKIVSTITTFLKVWTLFKIH